MNKNGIGLGPMADFCEYGNEPSCSIKDGISSQGLRSVVGLTPCNLTFMLYSNSFGTSVLQRHLVLGAATTCSLL
jgi:hypothetical protein